MVIRRLEPTLRSSSRALSTGTLPTMVTESDADMRHTSGRSLRAMQL